MHLARYSCFFSRNLVEVQTEVQTFGLYFSSLTLSACGFPLRLCFYMWLKGY